MLKNCPLALARVVAVVSVVLLSVPSLFGRIKGAVKRLTTRDSGRSNSVFLFARKMRKKLDGWPMHLNLAAAAAAAAAQVLHGASH